MPDYSKKPILFTDTKLFRDWLKEKGYAWPPANFLEGGNREREFWLEVMGRRL